MRQRSFRDRQDRDDRQDLQHHLDPPIHLDRQGDQDHLHPSGDQGRQDEHPRHQGRQDGRQTLDDQDHLHLAPVEDLRRGEEPGAGRHLH